MTRNTGLFVILMPILAMSWVASAWTLPEEVHDISAEIDALAHAVPTHPFEDRSLLGKEVDVTLPQLRDRLDDVRERLSQGTGGGFEQTSDDLATVQWELKDLETRVHGIALVQDESSYLVMREEMRLGLQGIDERMDAVVTALGRSENTNFAH